MNNNSRIELDITSSFKREGNILIINTVIKKSLFWHIMHGKTDLNIKDLCFYINSSVESICLWEDFKKRGVVPQKFNELKLQRPITFWPPSGMKGIWKFSSNLKSIGSKAFAGCQIEKVIFQNDCSIGTMCFENCTALTEIDNTYNTLLLDAGSFYNCNQLNKINFYNTALIDDARGIFQKCAFSRLELPTNWKRIPPHTFSENVQLQEVDFSKWHGRYSINVFSHCLWLKTIIAADEKQVKKLKFNMVSPNIKLMTLDGKIWNLPYWHFPTVLD